MSSDNLRIGRCSAPGLAYLVTTVTAARQPIFADFWLARAVITQMRRLHDGGSVASLAWVLMPDHLHWLFQLGDDGTLAQVMKTFKGRTAQTVHSFTNRQGAVWQSGYHDHALRAEDDVRQTARYLAGNPLRAGLVNTLVDYPHWDAVWV